MYCEKCGAEIKESDKFCLKCGHVIKPSGNRSDGNQTTITDKPREDKREIKSKKSHHRKILLGIVSVAIVLCVSVAVLGILGEDGRTPDQDFPTIENISIASKTFEFKVDRAWATENIMCPKEEQESFGSKYLTPIDENAIFYIVEYTFTNISDRAIDERPIIKLVDSTGVAYPRDEMTSLYVRRGGTSPDYSVYDEGIAMSETMGPGLSMKGQCTFVIAKTQLNEGCYITCSRPQITANSTVEWLTGMNLGVEEKIGVSLSGSPNDVIKELEVAAKEKEKQDMLAILSASDSGYLKVVNSTEAVPLYDDADKNSEIVCMVPVGSYLERFDLYDGGDFIEVIYEGRNETNPYKTVDHVGFIEKQYLMTSDGRTFETKESSVDDNVQMDGEEPEGEESFIEVKKEDIFVTGVNDMCSWYSPTAGYYLIPYMESNMPTVLFTMENTAANYATVFYAEITDIKNTANGGLDCIGTLYTASKDEPMENGKIEIIWDSLETLDFPMLKMIDGNQMTDTTMIASDYTYFGLLDD